MKYRIIRTHVETYVIDNIVGATPEDAIKFVEKNINPDEFESVEQSAYEYEAIPMDKLL